MSSNDRKRLETVLAYHTAPTFMGFKCGSLLTLSVKDYDLDELARLFEEGCFGRRIRARFISRSKERTLIYVYDIKLLSELLTDTRITQFLSTYGYDKARDIDGCLDTLCRKLQEKDFPHEVGIFLGYPLEDVEGFIRNCGQRCKYCGIWKVYGDVERAKALFECYRSCRSCLCMMIENGKQLRSCVA